MSSVVYMGRSYNDATDWLSVLRDAARYPCGPSWLRSDLDVASALAELAEHVKDTSLESSLAEAALSTVESESAAERNAVWQLPWERGSNAVVRLLRLVASDRQRLHEVQGVPNVFFRLLQAHPNDAHVLAALRAEAAAALPDPWVLELLARHAP